MQNRTKKQLLFLIAMASFTLNSVGQETTYDISGELKKWHKVTLTFEGPETSEDHRFNPFLHYRLNVTFRNGKKTYVVPGYFTADGNAANTSAIKGNKWRVHFAPDEVGEWTFEVSLRRGNNVAVSPSPLAGSAFSRLDGLTGSFTIASTDKLGRDNRAKGRLNYIGKHYLQFAETGEYFLKAGADAPENLLSYVDFDGNFKTDGHKDKFIKNWEAHVGDWKEGDPSWQGGKGKGLIGAINYLASKGMNAFSFLTLNIAGDDQNVFPYVSYDNYERFDCSKLDQWEILFEHADKLGMFLHFKTSEMENQGLLDGGELGIQRRLYYRELVARFGHHLSLNWNIGEENGKWVKNHPTPWQTTTQRLAMAQYFHEHDPYQHHVVIHNGQQFYDLLGPESKYTGISLQTHHANFDQVHPHTLKWRKLSADMGKPWAIAVDEPGDAQHSLLPDAEDPEHDLARQNALWGAFMAGAWGIEWYFGYKHAHSDLTCQDWRSRDKMWDQNRHALGFFRDNAIPFWEMDPMDDLTVNDDFVLGKEMTVYIIYQKMGNKNKTVLPKLRGQYVLRWYNPRTGEFEGKEEKLVASGELVVGLPPRDTEDDWVVWIQKL